MSSEEKFFDFAKLASLIASEKWGRFHSSSDDLIKSFVRDIDTSGLCLLRLVKFVDAVLDSISKSDTEHTIYRCQVAMRSSVSKWLAPKEASHGKCPVIVQDWAILQVCERFGWIVYRGYMTPRQLREIDEFQINTPRRGTEAGDEYRRWMRRKIKPTAAEQEKLDSAMESLNNLKT